MAYTVIGDEKFLVSATIGAGGSASFDDLSSSPLSGTTYINRGARRVRH